MNQFDLRPAALADFVSLYPVCPPLLWRAAVFQMTHFPALTIERNGKPIALAGTVPIGEGVVECWLMVPSKLKREPWARAFTLWLVGKVYSFLPGSTLCAYVAAGNEKSLRLTALCGFEPGPPHPAFPSRQLWVRAPHWPAERHQ